MHSNSIATPSLLLKKGYQYIELIGEGANGKTYKSKNLKTGEIVAIKALKFSENLKNYELFKREAETLKSIHTPGTPIFYDYIVAGSEFTECWLVQEYIDGKSILEMLENGEKFGEIKTLDLILQAAKIVHTLQTTYTPPIIHRDIKPSNILMRNKPKDNTNLCLIDFGAVANPQKRGLNSTVAGTVGYMAPEQLIGDCTTQSDYYALGATALHMMTGINPSEFETDGFTIQFEEKVKTCVPEIHKETIELLHKLLAPNPVDRPKNSTDLINQLSQLLLSSNSSVAVLNGKITLFEVILPAVSIVIFFVLVFFRNATLAILGVSFPLIILIISSRMVSKLKLEREQLSNYKIKTSYISIKKDPDSSSSDEADGTILYINNNIIEYVIHVGNKDYTAFYQNDGQYQYMVGDKVKVKYRMKRGKVNIISGLMPEQPAAI